MTPDPPIFVAIEGIDGSGQTSQAELLAALMQAEGTKVRKVDGVSSTPTGGLIRKWLRGKFKYNEPESIATLFLLDRYESYWSEIKPALDKGISVVCDRYQLTWEVYHGEKLTNEWLQGISMYLAVERPHVTVVLDMHGREEVAMERIAKRSKNKEIYETLAFQKRITARYLERAGNTNVSSVCTAVLDGTLPAEVLAREIRLLTASAQEHIKEINELKYETEKPGAFTPHGVTAIYWKSARARELYVQNHKYLAKGTN